MVSDLMLDPFALLVLIFLFFAQSTLASRPDVGTAEVVS